MNEVSLAPKLNYLLQNQSRSHRQFVLVIGFLGVLIGVALRVWIMLTPSLRMISSDIAVVGLEANSILQGHFHAFYWGQVYGGTLETFLVAAAFSAFNYSIIALSLVPMVLDLVAAILVWRIARYFLTDLEAIASGICFWVAPASYVWWSSKEVGFYWATMDIGLFVVLVSIRLVLLYSKNSNFNNNSVRPSKIPERLEWAFLGFLIGLGWWNSPDIMYFVVPSGLWIFIRRPRDFLHQLPIVIPMFILGALPWLWANFNSGFLSVMMPSLHIANNSYLDHLYSFFNGDLPVALGLKVPYQDNWITSSAKLFYFLIALPFLAIGLVVIAKRFVLLVLGIICYPFILAISPFSWWVGEARYALFLSPFLAILIVASLYKFGKKAFVGIGIAAMVTLSVSGLSIMSNRKIVPMNFSMKKLEKALYSHHIHYAYANYWIAYRLIFQTHSRIIVSPTFSSRNHKYDQLVNASSNPARLFVKGASRIKIFTSKLSKAGVDFVVYPAGHFVIYQTLKSSSAVKSIEKKHF